MKKCSKLVGALLAGCCLACCLSAGRALADTYTTLYFDDNTIAFPDAGPNSPVFNDDAPPVAGMTVTFDDQTGVLQSITVAFRFLSVYMRWSNLFIDADGANYGDWDYLVHSGGTIPTYPYDAYVSPIGDGVYTVADGYNYTYGLFYPGQPNGIEADYLTQISDITASQSSSGINGPVTLTYDLSSLDIVLSPDFIIGWVSFCGNNPILAYGDEPTGTVPEPATMVLFGAGMAALVGWRRRIRRA